MSFEVTEVKDTAGAALPTPRPMQSNELDAPELTVTDPASVSDDLLPEYRFDYSKARPNRFAPREATAETITLDADVAAVFTTREAVSAALRAVMASMPQTPPREQASVDRMGED